MSRALAEQITAEERARTAVNDACARETLKLAAKVKGHSAALDKIGEEDMGLLTAQMARKFHKAAKELREFNFWLQQVATEIE